ncbi:hypothetical protein B296_00023271, partial [Ensete ventricosum]
MEGAKIWCICLKIPLRSQLCSPGFPLSKIETVAGFSSPNQKLLTPLHSEDNKGDMEADRSRYSSRGSTNMDAPGADLVQSPTPPSLYSSPSRFTHHTSSAHDSHRQRGMPRITG